MTSIGNGAYAAGNIEVGEPKLVWGECFDRINARVAKSVITFSLHTPYLQSSYTILLEGFEYCSLKFDIARCKDVSTDLIDESVGSGRNLDPASIMRERARLPTTEHKLAVMQ